MATTPSKTPFMAFKLAVLVCLFFNFLAWLLLLGGISALEEVCHGGCRAAYGLAWWIIWFQLFLLVIAVVSEVKRLPVYPSSLSQEPLLLHIYCSP